MKLYALMVSGIVPRPVAFVSTLSEAGVHNLAPFSWFNQVSAYPPIISISCTNGPARVKDTANNIRTTKEFTVNIISEPWIENANATCIDAPESVSEWDLSGLTKEPSVNVKPPRVKESAFSMECELYRFIDITHPTTGQAVNSLILGLVKNIHVRNDVLTERGTVDIAKFKPLSRLGDISYGRIGDAFRLSRPVWSQEEETIKKALESV